ncbi:MAG: hypothetical protein O3A36_02335 [bacterium]|nr:hypothetical protein [bacterium]
MNLVSKEQGSLATMSHWMKFKMSMTMAIETANVVLMKSDPADTLRAIKLSKATVLN